MVTKAYVINLDDRKDRWDHIQKEFENIKSVELVRFPALKGKPGMIYCAKSHHKLLEQAFEDPKVENVLVLEDDVKLLRPETFDEEWSKIKERLDNNTEDWDVFNGGVLYLYPPMYLIDDEPLLYLTTMGAATHFMYYSRRAFEKLPAIIADINLKLWNGFDVYIPNHCRMVSTFPFLATQIVGHSDIDNKVVNRSEPLALSIQNYIASMSKYEEIDPKDYELYNAFTDYNRGKFQDSAVRCQKYLSKPRRPGDWYAHFLLGECFVRLGKLEDALENYMLSYLSDTERREGLWRFCEMKIANSMRISREQLLQLCVLLRDSGQAKPKYPLLNDATYKISNKWCIAILGSHCEYLKTQGLEACEYIIHHKGVDQSRRGAAIRSYYQYLEKFPSLDPPRSIVGDIGTPVGRTHTNPSIVQNIEKDGYVMNMRFVNYKKDLDSDKFYMTAGSKPCFQSINVIAKMGSDLGVLQYFSLDYKDLNLASPSSPVMSLGLEDIRLFVHRNRYCFVCTSAEFTPNKLPQMMFGRLAEAPDGELWKVDKLFYLPGPQSTRIEKNWMVLTKEDEVFLIYSYTPFKVYKVTVEEEHCEMIRESDTRKDLSRFLGSGKFIPFTYRGEKGFLGVTHEHIQDGAKRFYFHRWVWMDDNMDVKRASNAFFFDKKTSEFCMSLEWSLDGKNCIVSYGWEDRESRLKRYDPVEIAKSLVVEL